MEEEEGEGGGREGVCFSSGAKLQSEVDMEKPGNGKMVQRAAGSRLSRAPKLTRLFDQTGLSRAHVNSADPSFLFYHFISFHNRIMTSQLGWVN